MVMIKHLYPEVIKISRPLIVEDEVLKLCVKKFSECIAQCLTVEQAHRSTVKCNRMHIMDFPDGSETGYAFGLDISGKVFRIVYGTFRGDRVYGVTSRLYEIPEVKLKGSGYRVVEYIARCVANFVETTDTRDQQIILGVSIGFPIEQESLQDAKLLRWTADFKCDDFVQEDFFEQLKYALKRYRATKSMFLIAATNDAAASLLSGLYKDPSTRIGVTIGDQMNLCYLEKQDNVSIFPGDSIRTRTVLSLDFRSFGDDGCLNFIKTEFDTQIDSLSDNPGRHTLDKLVSGRYLGELFRLCIVRLVRDKLILDGVLKPKLKVAGNLRSEHIAEMESDEENLFDRCRNVFRKFGYVNIPDDDCVQIRFVARCIARRSANLLAAFLSALLNHLEQREVRICADGVLLRRFADYKTYLQKKIGKLKKPEVKYILTVNDKEDLGLGAGLLAFIYKDNVIKVEEKYRVLPPMKNINAEFALNGSQCADCDNQPEASHSGVMTVVGRQCCK